MDPDEFADLSLVQEVASAEHLIALAASLAANGNVADGEFHVCLLELGGTEQARILTNAELIADWAPEHERLPARSPSDMRWQRDLQREEAAVRAITLLREQMRDAWRLGAVSLTEAMRLVAQAGVILDPAEDEV
jgi:hypothetical protein